MHLDKYVSKLEANPSWENHDFLAFNSQFNESCHIQLPGLETYTPSNIVSSSFSESISNKKNNNANKRKFVYVFLCSRVNVLIESS